jgi:hypothetical protein
MWWAEQNTKKEILKRFSVGIPHVERYNSNFISAKRPKIISQTEQNVDISQMEYNYL